MDKDPLGKSQVEEELVAEAMEDEADLPPRPGWLEKPLYPPVFSSAVYSL